MENHGIIRKIAIGIIAFVFLLMIVKIVAIVILGSELINNPESFGEFFGRIVKGFESVN
jgi:hypothetical protein